MWATPSVLSVQNLSKSLGSWGGMSIIAIGPRGGKIVGYGTGGKPIYAGSPKAVALSQYRRAAEAAPAKQLHEIINEWLVEVGVPNKIVNEGVWVNPQVGQMIVDSYGVKPVAPKPGKPWVFNLAALQPHVGKPLVPHGAEKVTWAAKAAAGELDHDPFPKDLSTLKEIPAGKAAGSHGNRLFVSPDGKKWLFKDHDDVISRAEEAASRLGRLVFGPETFAAAKYVKLAGKDGVLLEWKQGAEVPQGSYHQPTDEFVQKYAKQLIEHQVFDWLISNHDSHAGNFLTTTDGKLVVIDKGQAWRFFGKDKLASDYSPNPSKPVYVKLWSMQKSGALGLTDKEIAEAAGRALDKIQKITPEQFAEIVKPYAATRAKKYGTDAAELATDLVNRRNDVVSDWAKFLNEALESPSHQIHEWMAGAAAPGKDVPAPKHTPDEPTVIEGGAKAPIVAEPAAGWPQTKGKVTIAHPGNPPIKVTGGKGWPAGYPGPGFQASIEYKGKHYDVEFSTIPGTLDEIQVTVYYPDGSSRKFDSPNKASDSLYLFHQGLPLDMSATEKKAKGISYPASKAFGILAFKQELAEAQGGVVPASAKTVTELEAEGTVKKEQQYAAAATAAAVAAVVSEEPSKPGLPNWETMPDTPAGKVAAGLGKMELATWLSGAPVGASVAVPTYGTFTKLSDTKWHDNDGTEGSTFMVAEVIADKGGQIVKKPTPKPAAAPTPAPVTAGVKETIVNKPGLGDVVLQPQPDGTFTVGFTFQGSAVIQNFKSISAAAKFAFIHQKGFKTAADYQAAMGKPPPGVSWGFFGIKQETKPVAEPVTPPATTPPVETKPPLTPLDLVLHPELLKKPEFPEGAVSLISLAPATMDKHPVGTEIGWKVEGLGQIQSVKLVKQGDGSWKAHDTSPTAYMPDLWIGGGTAEQMWDTYWSHEDGGAWIKSPAVAPKPDKFILLNHTLTGKYAANQPVGTELSWTEKNGDLQYAKKIKPDTWEIKYSAGNVEHVSDLGVASETSMALDSEVWIAAPKAAKPKVKSKLPENVKPASLEVLPAAIHDKLNVMIPAATEWSTKLTTGGPPVGAKPPTWNPWVPPAGVLIEGKVGDKTYWLITVVAGYQEDTGKPHPKVQLALIDQDGNIHHGTKVSGKLAIKSLEHATAKAGLSMPVSDIKAAWGLEKITFAPGETYLSVKDGTGPSEIPMASEVVKEPAQDMVPVLKETIVKTSMPLNVALTKHPKGESLALKPQKDGKHHWLTLAGSLPDLETVISDFGLQDIVVKPQQVNDGAKVLIPSWALNQEVVVTTTAFEVASVPKPPGAENFATMPEGVPMQFTGKETGAEIHEAIQKVPSGTAIHDPTSNLIYALSGEQWSVLTAKTSTKIPQATVAEMIAQHGGVVIPPGAVKPEAPAPTWTPKTDWKQTAEAHAKAEHAKAATEWAKGYPPVTDPHALSVLAHLQKKLGPKVKFWARVGAENSLILGSDSPSFAKAMKAAGLGWDDKPTVKTPFGGMKRYGIDALKEQLPSTGTIEGPDGNQYPAGTTFDQKVVTKTIQNLIESEPSFYKFSEHKTDADKLALKIKGTGPDQIAAAKAILEKYKLPAEEPKVGGSNTIVGIPKSILNAIGESKTITVPEVPPQPDPYIAKPLPFVAGAIATGQPVGVNRHDLSMLEAIKPSRLGHPILIGKPGVWRDGQVWVRKIKGPGGVIKYEVHGDIPHYSPVGAQGMASAYMNYTSTAGTSYDWSSYQAQTYDQETGAQVETGQKLGKSHTALVGKTPAGSTVAVTTAGTASVKGTFRLEVAAGADVEKELAKACEMVGLNVEAAMAEPTTDDVRILKKYQIVRSLSGPAAFADITTEQMRDEAWLDKRLKDFKFPQEKVESAELRMVADGKIATVIPDDDRLEKAKEKGFRFVYVGHESIGGLVARFKEGGYGSGKRRLQNGNIGNQTSMSGDENVGGSWGIFTRIGHTDHNGSFGGVKGGNSPKVIFHPRVLNRTDWYWHPGDKYGSTQSGSDGRYKAMEDGGGTSNECSFLDGLSIRDAAGVVVWSGAQREEVIKTLKDAGFGEGVNGIPLEKFVIQNAGANRDEIAEALEGLKPGVLP